MCTSPVIYRPSRRKAVTLTELIVVLVVVGIVATISIVGWQGSIEREYKANARETLNALLRAEQNFFAWKGRFTSDWTTLEIDDPNNSDDAYSYALENATEDTLFIRATRQDKGKGLIMDQDGNIQEF